MWLDVIVSIRKFERQDIPKKVEWINNPENNKYLHYNIPISVEGTEAWFISHEGDTNRFDAIVEVSGVPVGTIGLLSIDRKNSKAEYYIAMGEKDYTGKGVAKEASRLLLKYGFEELGLNRIYLYTETENEKAQRLFERLGFTREGMIRKDIFSRDKYVDRYLYSILREEWGK